MTADQMEAAGYTPEELDDLAHNASYEAGDAGQPG